MDIAALSSSYSGAMLVNEASQKVLAMTMDDAKVMGEGIQKMLEMSVNPNLGVNIDISL